MRSAFKPILWAAVLLSPLGCGKDETSGAASQIVADRTEITLCPGESASISVTPVPEDAQIGPITWESTDEGTVTVDSNGKILAVAPGQALVRAVAGSYAAQCIVHVVPGALELVVPDEDTFTLTIGDTCTVGYTTVPEYAETEKVTWNISDRKIATVDADGRVIGLYPGETFLTIDADGIKATCKISVLSEKADVGHFLYSDGATCSRLLPGKEPVAIVFYTGNPSNDDPVLASEHPYCTHGLAVSVCEDIQSAWQNNHAGYGKTVGSWCEDNSAYKLPEAGTGQSDPVNRICGYNNTKALTDFNTDPANYTWKIQMANELCYFILENVYPAPEKSSGWYIPSAKEMSLLVRGRYDGNIWDNYGTHCRNLEKVNEAIRDSGAGHVIEGSGFWCSSEADKDMALYMNCTDGKIMTAMKNIENARVRPILAF